MKNDAIFINIGRGQNCR
ncbi:hypothetical protein ACVNP0_00155 [Staphylococcus aureus]